MSGRLVILPHKSWNVWNRDNREKVARDERLHREEQERLALANRQLLQEQTNELLLNKSGESSCLSELSSAAKVESMIEKPFRLFDDLEQHALSKKLPDNEDYKREHEARLLAQQRKQGVAPLALGDGSLEFSKSKPWYVHAGRHVEAARKPNLEIHRWGENDVDGVIKRENERKAKHDPASCFHGGVVRIVDRSFSEAKESDPLVEPNPGISDENGQTHSRKSKKGQKKSKAVKHRHHGTKLSRDVYDGSESSSRMLEELRIKRLEREKAERKRSNILLAHMDVYGSSNTSVTDSRSYHSQYYPTLSRK
jgi:hypothetical protein